MARLARERDPGLPYVVADMRALSLARRFDLAALLMDSSSYLLTNDDVLQFLQGVAACLNPGGALVLEMGHPRDVFRVGTSTGTDWTMVRDDLRVHTVWGDAEDPFDPTTQITDVSVRNRVGARIGARRRHRSRPPTMLRSPGAGRPGTGQRLLSDRSLVRLPRPGDPLFPGLGGLADGPRPTEDLTPPGIECNTLSGY